MLAERVREWNQEWIDKGREQGLKDGEAAVLMTLLNDKFGPLEEQDRQRIQQADSETLMRWARQILVAERAEDVFS